MQPLSAILGFLGWGVAIKTDGAIHVARNFSRRTAIDALAIASHVVLWLVVPTMVLGARTALLNYAVIIVLNGVYMGGILVVPHVGAGMDDADDDLSFFERQVRFSRNYNATWFGTLLCGGLNLQIEHHLLPHIPCVRLRRTRPAILAYCLARGLPYRQTRYWSAWGEVLSYLRRMSRIAAANDGREVEVMPIEEEAS